MAAPYNATILRVVAADRPPFIYSNSSSPYGWSGLLVDLLPVVLALAGLNATLKFHKSPSNTGGVLQNGTWTGVAGEMIYGRADIAAFPFSQSWERLPFMDFTFPFDGRGLAILIKRPIASDAASVFTKPFAPSLWVLAGCTVIGFALVLNILSWMSPLGNYKVVRIRNMRTQAEEQRYVLQDTSKSYLVDVLMTLNQNAPMPRSRSWSIRISSAGFYFFMIILISAYTANFTSVLTANQLIPTVTSLQDILRSNESFAVNSGGGYYTYMTQSTDAQILTLQPQLKTANATIGGVEAVRSGRVIAYITELPSLIYFAGLKPCDLEVVGTPFGPAVLVMGLQKNSSYTKPINTAMERLKANGYLDTLNNKWIYNSSQCASILGQEDEAGALSLDDFSGLYLVLLHIILISSLWVAFEKSALVVLSRHPRLAENLAALRAAFRRRKKRFDLVRAFSQSHETANSANWWRAVYRAIARKYVSGAVAVKFCRAGPLPEFRVRPKSPSAANRPDMRSFLLEFNLGSNAPNATDRS
ncbi:glutamate receptor [Klebsormidium nitens]|uniref:Glutamate receptor n=1 Tax=Klebsormidium nitens TaxID=105231 RepID=A0A1Y1HV14_KLENI|nr:glutamate receptor [Klebsormidium nitens]|eukprot:GAQ82470.1 glutamate receptor [Klebsormidium nitens]